MQCDAVAFAIEDDGAKTVIIDLVFGMHHFAAVGSGLHDCVVEPARAIEIHERAARAGRIFLALGQIQAAA